MAAAALADRPGGRARATARQRSAVRPAAACASTARTARCRSTAGASTGPTYQLRDPDDPEMDQGRRPGARPRLQRAGRRADRSTISSSRPRTGCRPGRKRSRHGRQGKPTTAGPQRARPDAGLLRRRPGRRRTTLLVTDNDRAFTRTVRKPAPVLAAMIALGAVIICRSCCRCSSRGPSSGRCAGSRWPRTASGSAARARSRSRACPREPTRSACSPARSPT